MHTVQSTRQPNTPPAPSHSSAPATKGVPQGTVYVPGPEDHVPLQQAPKHQVPDFIPLRLDAPENAAQAELAHSVMEERGDFDPEVDNENDVFVGTQGMQPTQGLVKPAAPGAPRAPANKTTIQQSPNHPVLDKLRARFGLRKQGTKDADLGGIVFTFRKYTNDAYVRFTNRYVKSDAETVHEYDDKIPYAILSIGIAAIDGVPTHEVFGVDINPVTEASLVDADPMYPPTDVIVRAAARLYPYLLHELEPELFDYAYKKYGELYPDEKFVDPNDAGKYVFECIEPGCSESIRRVPRMDAQNIPVPFHCPVHGTRMRVLGPVEALGNIPLA